MRPARRVRPRSRRRYGSRACVTMLLRAIKGFGRSVHGRTVTRTQSSQPNTTRWTAGAETSNDMSTRSQVSVAAAVDHDYAEYPAAHITNEAALDIPVVNSHNEFDPLEEVIVGSIEDATIPEWHVSGKAVWPQQYWDMYKTQAGQPFRQDLMDGARKELDGFAEILRQEGVIVRRPDAKKGDFSESSKTPDFEINNGLYAAMPRDLLIVVGNEIIEAPMAWRSRFFEYRPYRKLMKEYFQRGAKWTTAPKPLMSDELYRSEDSYVEGQDSFVTTEFEPVFDAAEFTRIGKDIFVQRSQVTNMFGIEWMRRHLGPDYTIHVLDFQDKNAMHIDGTFVPLGPGKLLVNPKRPCVTGKLNQRYTYDGHSRDYKLPDMFKGWDVFMAETPLLPASHPLYFTSPWTASCNVIMLDHERVCVEAHETTTIKKFEEWGFKPVLVPFRNFLPFGGSFHCATTDIRRRGVLQNYF